MPTTSEAPPFEPVARVDRQQWAQRAEEVRNRLVLLLRGTALGDRRSLETRRARVVLDHGTRLSLMRVTVTRWDRTGRGAAVFEVPLYGTDPYVLAALVRAASRTPWRSRLRRALRLH
jgi:hypothetical protein